MSQQDNAARNTQDDRSIAFTATEQYLAEIYPYSEIILDLSQWLLHTSMNELISDPEKVKNAESLIADAVGNLEKLGRSPPNIKFNKGAVLKALKKARVELSKALFLARLRDPSCFDHIDPCRDYLNAALRNMPSKKA